MGPAASGRGLCDIDRVLFRVTKSRVKKWEVLAQRKYTDNGVFDPNYNWYIFVSQELPIFLSRDLVTLNNTLSHSPRPLAAGTIQNAKIMESLLCMQQKKSIPSV